MKVVRVNDFDIPSDENDYDELVAFADTMASIEQFEAIPKADYENRLKAEKIAMLEELDLQIDESAAYNLEVAKVQRLIRDKINILKEQEDGNDRA